MKQQKMPLHRKLPLKERMKDKKQVVYPHYQCVNVLFQSKNFDFFNKSIREIIPHAYISSNRNHL